MDLIDNLKEALSSHKEVRIALLFGSLAKGSATPDSDVDVGLQLEHPMSAAEKAELIGEIAAITGRAVDLVDLATVGEPLLGEILVHGRKLVANREDYTRLMLRHLYDAADFGPYRDRILRERRQTWIGR